jgi:glycosyltransferase involved in cell wall biosynthesis
MKLMSAPGGRTTIAVAVCTYKRNDLLTRLLEALLVCAEQVRDRAAIGVVLVDDTAEGRAEPVADAYAERFELGLHYRISGKQNISLARNIAIETSMGIGEWIAMTDDDCEPPPQWLRSLLDLQHRTGADAVTGRVVRRVPPGSPRWLTEQPFLELGVEKRADGAEMESAATFNSMILSSWLQNRPQIRFDPHFGVIGGEDMVFFRAAHAAGLRICFSEKGFTYENEPPSRATLGYQLYVYFWQGNSSSQTCLNTGVRRSRMFVHGCACFARAVLRPFARGFRGQPPQLRYCAALMGEAIGKISGSLGLQIDHR